MKHEIIKFYPLQVWYVYHKHEIDPNSNVNYSRKIGPMTDYHCRFHRWLHIVNTKMKLLPGFQNKVELLTMHLQSCTPIVLYFSATPPCGLILHPRIARTRYMFRFYDFFLLHHFYQNFRTENGHWILRSKTTARRRVYVFWFPPTKCK